MKNKILIVILGLILLSLIIFVITQLKVISLLDYISILVLNCS